MPSHVLNPLQARIFALLDGDATLGALVNAIHDNTPDEAPLPYVVIGDDSMSDFGGHTFDGFEGPVTIHAWTEGEGRKANKDILNRIYEILHNIDIAIPGFTTIVFRCTLSEVLLDPDNRTYHGIQRYNLTVTEE